MFCISVEKTSVYLENLFVNFIVVRTGPNDKPNRGAI